jgi:hypothetical protein
MQYSSMLGRKLWATLCEIEPGLFSVRYRSNATDGSVLDMPIYQVATCAADAEQRVENRARTCGFEAVVWDNGFATPATFATTARVGVRSNAGERLVAGK